MINWLASIYIQEVKTEGGGKRDSFNSSDQKPIYPSIQSVLTDGQGKKKQEWDERASV